MKQKLKKLELPDNYWGISPESLYIYLADIALKTDFLNNLIKTEILEKKVQKDENEYRVAIAAFAEHLNLSYNNHVQPLGKIALLSSEPLFFFQTLLVSKDLFCRHFMVAAKDQQIKVVSISELASYFPTDTEYYRKLLQSFHFLTMKKNKAILEQPIIQRVAAITSFSAETGNWLSGRAFFETLFPGDIELDEKLTCSLLASLNIPFERDSEELSLVEALKHLGNNVEQTLQAIISRPDAVMTTLDLAIENLGIEDSKLLGSLKSSKLSNANKQVNFEELGVLASKFHLAKNKLERVINQIVFLQDIYPQLYLPYVLSLSQVPLDCIVTILERLFGNEVRVDEYSVVFRSTFTANQEITGDLNEYLSFVMRSFAKNEERVKKIKEMKSFLGDNTTPNFANSIQAVIRSILHNRINALSNKQFSPFYFVYTCLFLRTLVKRELITLRVKIQSCSERFTILSVNGPT
ncbi:MAG: hypothetical protein NWF04_01655 [Candidatus Bathyarchaeota archaeon]|nr:hypothetical protein [Candidatus Bathyarchaeota archaeon]